MSTGRQIDFSRWPKESAAASEGCAVPYLDIDGEDEPVDFLFRFCAFGSSLFLPIKIFLYATTFLLLLITMQKVSRTFGY